MRADASTGPYIGLVARDAGTAVRLLGILGSASRIEPHELWPRLRSERPPAALIIEARDIDVRSLSVLHRAQLRGVLPPVVIYCRSLDERAISNAWDVRRIDARLVFRDDQVKAVARTLLAQPITGGYALQRIRTFFLCDSPDVVGILQRMSSDAAALTQSVGRIASHEGLSRTALYDAFSRARLPTPGKVRLLFSLDIAFQASMRGTDDHRAARLGGYADVRSMRAALSRLGVGLRDMRQARERSWLFDRWLAYVLDRSDPFDAH